MKIRKTFLIRWWVSLNRNQEPSVIDVEHIQSGDTFRAASLEEANEWMKQNVSVSDPQHGALNTDQEI